MIQIRTILNVADNSGAKKIRVMLIHGGSRHPIGKVGNIVTASVLKADPHGAIKSGERVKAVVVRTKKELRRKDGSYIRFDENAAVIINGIGNPTPVATRVFGPVAREIKELGYNKIASLAPEVL